jgi:predicted acylesterase/phospholipase RssA
LRDANLLTAVKRIGAVSGGSVLAAHLVLNWERYTGTTRDFEAAAQELIAFTRSDVRGRVVRRWILAWLTLVPRLLKRKRWTFTNLLQQQYRLLYKDKTLGDLRSPTRPQVFFYATSLTSGAVCSFGRSGFMWDEDGSERSVTAPRTPIAFAVAASSAFPPLFPPIAVSSKVLSCDIREFPNPQYLTDGGVYDNLGIDRLMWYDRKTSDLNHFIISDAEGAFDWDFKEQYTFITTRNIRASDLLMKRVSSLEYQALALQPDRITAVGIDTVVERPDESDVLSPEIQRALRKVRTDLDRFSASEASSLIRHGYTTAREQLRKGEFGTPDLPGLAWEPCPRGRSADDLVRTIHGSSLRRLRLWAWGDWVSWVSLCVMLALIAGVAAPIYLQQTALRKRLAEAAQQSAGQTKLAEAQLKFAQGVVAAAAAGDVAVPKAVPILTKISGEGEVVPPTKYMNFRVRATDVSGHPLEGVKVAWQTPAGGQSVYVSVTDSEGNTEATNIYAFPNAGIYVQLASVVAPNTPRGKTTADAVAIAGPSVTFTFRVGQPPATHNPE